MVVKLPPDPGTKLDNLIKRLTGKKKKKRPVRHLRKRSEGKKLPVPKSAVGKKPKTERGKMAKGGRPGLYANIHAKRKSGRPMRKKGAKGAPTAANFRRAAQTARTR
tara:strand:- start:159 stop:479 length:321 start_codon:yes stop_codon:yes gene_type:complete